jgi:coproporphyrinogen III oxidase
VKGPQLPPSATQHRPELAGAPFEAMGVSLVFHPRNPMVPTVHMNVRMFAALPAGKPPVVWFGGGMDLTPYYGRGRGRRALPPHLPRCAGAVRRRQVPALQDLVRRVLLPQAPWRAARHRRGVLRRFRELGFEQSFAMLRAVGDAFLPAYLPIAQRRRNLPYGERERDFQAYRRGRYVEFNLVFDRGTLFGLQSGGRTESILMSMPPS